MNNTEPKSPRRKTHGWRRRGAGVAPSQPGGVGRILHYGIVVVVVGIVGYTAVLFFNAAAKRTTPEVPSTMEAVNWESPDSSQYCLACHRPVGPAMAGLDVEHGHPQNVRLNAEQLQAVAGLGTITGPDNTLICVTCHKLGAESSPYMLADTLVDGKFCEHCHPGHYARGTPHDLRLSAPQEQNRLGQTVSEGGPCSACHLAHRYARDFASCDHDPDGRCTTCHEVDLCASGHARTTMEHPESRCLECHDPHDASHGEFLNAPVTTLCVRCHESYDDGTSGGMHPLTALNGPLPQELINAGAWVESDASKVTCTLCHQIHEANHEPLLVLEPDSNRLCLTCHADKHGAEQVEGMSPHHGQSPQMTAEQRAVADLWKTGTAGLVRVGPDGELLCVTCHQVHHSAAKPALLAFAPKYGDTCGACHPRHDGLVGTSHDLRTNFPNEPNLAGMTPAEHGACSACHLAHGYARDTSPAPGDPSGQCVSCHQANGCAAGKTIVGVQHADTTCTDCHNPHERGHSQTDRNYLASPEPQLCTGCHAEQARLVGGPHDCTVQPDLWPKEITADANGICTSCHVPHGGERSDMFRVHGANPVGNHDDVCLVCHPNAAWGASSAIAAIHPHDISPDQNKVELALVPKDESGQLRMGCRTCHDPHGGASPLHLARVHDDEPTETLCLHCHEEKQYIQQTGHSAESLVRFGYDVDSCKPCHAMHADPNGSWGLMLSPRFLMDDSNVTPGQPPSEVICLVCHNESGPAPVRDIATHPRIEMFNIHKPDSPGFLPLFNDAGKVDPHGHVVCRTCHLSHGRLDLLKFVAERTDTAGRTATDGLVRPPEKRELTPSERHAIRTQLRTFEPPNICSECHGEQARIRFLFFHDPDRRKPPRQ